MANLNIAIEIAAKDAASGIVGGITGALKSMGDIAGGAVSYALGNVLTGALDMAKTGLVDAFNGALEAQQGMAALTSSLDRLGARAPITADQAVALADQFKNLVGGSDDMVIAMEDAILRFDQIGSDTFPAVIAQSADLAAALKMDPVKAAELLGKTLQDLSTDGTASIGRLKTAGVQLTDEQEKQIEAMVKAGDTAGAQKVLLDALAATTGGKAADAAGTLAGQWAIFTESLADAGEGVMLSILPALQQLVSDVLVPMLPQIQALAGAFSAWLVDTLVPAVQMAVAWITANWPLIQVKLEEFWAAAQPIIAQFAAFVQDVLLPALAVAVAWVVANWPLVQAKLEEFWAVVQPIVAAVVDFVQNQLVPAFMNAVDWVVTNWPAIQATIAAVMTAIQDVIATVLSAIQAFWAQWGDEIMLVINTTVANAQTLFAAFAALFQGDFYTFGEYLRVVWDNTWKAIGEIITSAINYITTIDWGAVGLSILQGIAGGITAGIQVVADAARGAASAALEAAKGFLGIHSPSTAFAEVGQYMMQGMALGVRTNAPSAINATTAAAGGALAAAGGLGGGGTSVGSLTLNINGGGDPQATAQAVLAALADIGLVNETRLR